MLSAVISRLSRILRNLSALSIRPENLGAMIGTYSMRTLCVAMDRILAPSWRTLQR